MSDEQLLTVREVAARLRLSQSMVWALIARGDLPSFAIGRTRRVAATALNSWIADRIASGHPANEMAASDSTSETAKEAGREATQRSEAV